MHSKYRYLILKIKFKCLKKLYLEIFMFGAVILIYVKCTKLAEFIFEKNLPSQKLFAASMIGIF